MLQIQRHRESGWPRFARSLIEPYLAFRLVGGMVSEYTMKTCRVETKLVRNSCSYTWLLPEPSTLYILAGIAWIVPGARFLEHATPNTGASFADFLDFFAPRIGEASPDLWLCGLLVHAEVSSEVGLSIRVHCNWPWMSHAFAWMIVVRQGLVLAMFL